jgi:homoserine dehydrogenase
MRLKGAGDIRSKFYIRFLVEARAGAFGTIASILGRHNVSISAASQKAGSVGKEPVPVVALTHLAKSADLEAALDEIMESGVVGGRPVSFRVL